MSDRDWDWDHKEGRKRCDRRYCKRRWHKKRDCKRNRYRCCHKHHDDW
jgi:hypothetical protein